MANKWPTHAENLTTSKKGELCNKFTLILCNYTAVAQKMYNTKFTNSQQTQVVYTF